jgi:hypothetical protein
VARGNGGGGICVASAARGCEDAVVSSAFVRALESMLSFLGRGGLKTGVLGPWEGRPRVLVGLGGS